MPSPKGSIDSEMREERSKAVRTAAQVLYAAHLRLDKAGVPRVIRGEVADLPERIAFLEGMLRSAEVFNLVIRRRAKA